MGMTIPMHGIHGNENAHGQRPRRSLLCFPDCPSIYSEVLRQSRIQNGFGCSSRLLSNSKKFIVRHHRQENIDHTKVIKKDLVRRGKALTQDTHSSQ